MRPIWIILLAVAATQTGCGSDESAANTRVAEEATRGPVHVRYQAESGTAAAGTRVEVTIIATCSPESFITPPLLDISDGEAIGELHVLSSRPTVDVPLQGGGHQWTQSFVVDSFVPGTHALPELSIHFIDRRTTTEVTGHVDVAPLELTIVSSLKDEQASMHDIVGWMTLPGGAWWPWLLAGGGFLIVMVGGAIWLMAGSRAAGPPPTPAELARAALDALRGRGELASGQAGAFYTDLSSIVRRYIEGRFGLAAPRKTTDEFLRDAERDDRLVDSQRLHLREFLRTADLVKFAGHEPAAEQGTLALTEADHFVDDCEQRLQEQAEVPAGEAAPC